jgi:hypothetical protein
LATHFKIWSPASPKLFQKQFNFESFDGIVQRVYIYAFPCVENNWLWFNPFYPLSMPCPNGSWYVLDVKKDLVFSIGSFQLMCVPTLSLP